MTVELGASLFRIVFGIYVGAALCYLWYLMSRNETMGKAGTALLVIGLPVHTASLVVRTIVAERPPFLNLYEYMLSLTWGFTVVYLILELRMKTRSFGTFAVPLLTLITAYSVISLPYAVNATMPALMSVWRVPHIATAILGYSSFCIAFGLAIMYLIRESAEKKEGSFWLARIPEAKQLDQVTYRLIAFGFLMQTFLLITGAMWAQYAWGRYWGWDPKETWALVTWLIYAAYLHTRVTLGWRGRRSAIMVIAGFAATMCTLLGVSLFLSGLHSYA